MSSTIQERTVDGTASRQWATRPADQRFTSIEALKASILARKERSTDLVIDLKALRAVNNGNEVYVALPDGRELMPTNHSFSQLCQSVGAPASYLRTLNASLAADCLDRGMRYADGRNQLLTTDTDLRGITGENYGRIWDIDLANEIERVVDSGRGRWTVPTAFRTANSPDLYPTVDPTTESTTLYASDRDVFMFLVDELNPIQAGFLPNGQPDLFYRGFYAWNGECGGVSNGIATFLYRYVCSNRNIWGQRGFNRFTIKHTKHAGLRFASDMLPALTSFVDGSVAGLEQSLIGTKTAKIARTDDERSRILATYGFGPGESAAILRRCLAEEGHPAETVFDFVQGITAYARAVQNADTRIAYEVTAGKILAQAMPA